MMNHVEKIRTKLASGGVVSCVAVSSVDPAVTELLGQTGVDTVFLDLEHGLLDLETTNVHLMVAHGTGMGALIRVPSFDPVAIKPILDLQPTALIVPRIESPQEAATAVRACKYPPKGVRGYAPRRGWRYGAISKDDYLKDADDQTLVIIQIEDIKAVQSLDEILAIPGVDSVVLGPNDLAASMGLLWQITHPKVVEAMEHTISTSKAHGVPVGVAAASDPDSVKRWIKMGLQWLMLGSDLTFLFEGAQQRVQALERMIDS